MKPAAGTKLGRYEILAEIGRGGMGVVYRARDPKIDRLVAIKTISFFDQELEDAHETLERFVLEARAAGRLSHPGIVTIFDVGEEPERHNPYIVMEYVAGSSLRKMLSAESKKVPLETALQLTQEIAEGLHYAHSQGVIHRDVKPSNILVTNDGHAKIADFGIAKLNLSQLTVPGQLWGSPAYMSPEQLNGENVDARSDLFSLGVILYTMITGYRPFQGNSATTVCFKVVNREPIPATSFDAGLPAALDRLIAQAMAKEPTERFQSGRDMSETIAHFLQTHEFKENGEAVVRTTTVTVGSVTTAGASQTGTRSTRNQTTSSNRVLVNRGVNEERALVAAFILLLASASFVLYRGLTSVLKEPATQTTAAVQIQAVKETTAPQVPDISERPPQPPPRVGPTRTIQAIVTAKAMLRLDIQDPFPEAEATVWIDNHEVYSRMLRGAVEKHALVLRQVRGHDSETIQVPAGEHMVHVRVRTPDDSYDQSKTISGILPAEKATVLDVMCEKHGSGLTLNLH